MNPGWGVAIVAGLVALIGAVWKVANLMGTQNAELHGISTKMGDTLRQLSSLVARVTKLEDTVWPREHSDR